MDYEMDQTQALPMDEDEDYEEEQSAPDKVVAQLKVLTCKGFPETIFDIKEGANIIGRYESNQIVITLKSLSKQHACIEVHGDSHLIYDMGSRNKTRRGKLFLKPNIRYELKNCDILTLADVTCQYLLSEETGNMSDSSGSIDILQPTQVFPAMDNVKRTQSQSAALELKTPMSHELPRRVFAEDSDDNVPSAAVTPGNQSIIPDTQPARSASKTLIQESDSDTDMEEDNVIDDKSVNETDLDLTDLANASTQAVNVKSVDEFDRNLMNLANASTQAINDADLETLPACNATELDPADMATQAYQTTTDEDDEVETNKFDAAEESTLAYDTEEEDKDNAKQIADSALEPTQAFAPLSPVAKYDSVDESMDVEDSCDEPTQSFVAAPTQPVMNSTQDDDHEDIDPATAATQAIADQSSVAYNTDDEMAPTQAYGGDDAMAPTQAFGGDDAMAPTQAFGGDDAMAPTQAYGGDDAMAPTQAYCGDDAMAPTQAYGGDDAMAPTQAYGGDDEMAPTQAYGGDDEMAPTQAYGGYDEMAPTQAYGGDDEMAPTQPYNPKHGRKVSDDEEAEDDANDVDEPTQAYGLDDACAPTQAYVTNDQDDDNMAPTQAYTDVADQSTLAYDTVDGDNQEEDDADAPTLAFGNDADNKSDLDDCEEPTQAYGFGENEPVADDNDEPTQAYGVDAVSEMTPPQNDDDEPTQAYGLDAEAEMVAQQNDEDEPTQAYGLNAEPEMVPQQNDEDKPSKAYGDVLKDDTEDDTEEIVTNGNDAADEADGETQIPDSEGEDEAMPTRGRRIESMIAQIPAKSAMASPNREDKPKKALHVAFKENTPESDVDSDEEMPVPTKHPSRGRRGKPAKKDRKKKVEETPGDADDVDIAPTRKKSLRHKKKSQDSDDGGSPSPPGKTKGKRKAVKQKQTSNKDDNKKTLKSSIRNNKINDSSVGSRKINEFFKQQAVDSSEDNDDTPSKEIIQRTVSKKLSPKKDTVKASEPPRKRASRKSSRRKPDDGDTDSTESLQSTSDRLKDLNEVDCGSTLKGPRRNTRGTKIEMIVEPEVRTSGTRGGKQVDLSVAQEKIQSGKKVKSKGNTSLSTVDLRENIKLSPVEIRLLKMDLSSDSLDSDSCLIQEPEKPKTQARGRRSVATASVVEDDDLGKSEPVPQRSSRGRVKQNDLPSKDEHEKIISTPTTSRATRGKRGMKKNEKIHIEEDLEKNVPVSNSRKGRKRGGKDKLDEKAEAEEEFLKETAATSSHTTPKRKKIDEKSNSETPSSDGIRTSKRAASRMAHKENGNEEEHEDGKKSTQISKGKVNPSKKTVDTDGGTSKRGHRLTPDPSPTSEKQSTFIRRSTGRQRRQISPQRSEDEETKPEASETFKKPGPMKKSGRGKVDEESDDVPRKENNIRKGKNVDPVTKPQAPSERRGKRNHSPNQSPSPSSSPSSSPSPAKRARQAENATNEVHSPSLRKRLSAAKPKVLFTGVTDKEWDKIVKSLGGELVESVYDCTHLITDKVRRTVKFLCCLSKGALILNTKWLDMCKASKSFVDPMPYLLKDNASEKQHKFSLLTSYQKASSVLVLKGTKVHVTPGVKPDPLQMKDIIKCAGGEFLNKLPSKPDPNTVVISCEQDLASVSGVGDIPIVSAEFILTGMLRQEADPQKYQLDVGSPASKRRSSLQPPHGGKRRR